MNDGKAIVLKFAEDFPTVDSVNARDVWRWFDNKRHGINKLGVSRRRKIKGQLASYWGYLQKNLAVPIVPEDVHPFADVKFPKKKKTLLTRST